MVFSSEKNNCPHWCFPEGAGCPLAGCQVRDENPEAYTTNKMPSCPFNPEPDDFAHTEATLLSLNMHVGAEKNTPCMLEDPGIVKWLPSV